MQEENKKVIWFKAKTYGYGWYPSTWQGWAVIVLYICALTSNALFVDDGVHSTSEALLYFVPNTFILTIFLIIISYATGEKATWNSGKNKSWWHM